MTRKDLVAAESKAVRVGNYKFTGKVLGKGSFAVVQEATHVNLKVKVSIKTINMAKCNSYVLKHLKRESTILQQLDHPYIMRLFETMSYGTMYFLVTELVSGGDLLSHLQQQKGKQLVEPVTRKFIRQVTTALGYLHAKGIVHRDLKLENIMLDSRKENIKLVDFGLSNRWLADCPLKTLCGSPEYCAPELFIHGTQYGPEVDMWALGVISYTMAVGQLPFPCVSVLMKDPEKKSLFIKLVHNGLSQQHIDRIVGYSTEFIDLLKGLLNPKNNERLSVADIVKDPWLSNNNHWVSLQHESLDAYDLANVHSQVCRRLEITEDRLKSELHSRPSGEMAGYLNIMLNEYTRRSKQSSSVTTKNAPRYFKDSFPNKQKPQYIPKETVSKIWVVGAARKINEVIRAKRPLARSIYTSTTSSAQSSIHSHRNCKSDQSGPKVSFGAGDWISKPRIGPLKAKKADDSSTLNTPQDKIEKTSEKLVQMNTKFKKKSAVLHQPLLPSKLKPTSLMSKFNMSQERKI